MAYSRCSVSQGQLTSQLVLCRSKYVVVATTGWGMPFFEMYVMPRDCDSPAASADIPISQLSTVEDHCQRQREDACAMRYAITDRSSPLIPFLPSTLSPYYMPVRSRSHDHLLMLAAVGAWWGVVVVSWDRGALVIDQGMAWPACSAHHLAMLPKDADGTKGGQSHRLPSPPLAPMLSGKTHSDHPHDVRIARIAFPSCIRRRPITVPSQSPSPIHVSPALASRPVFPCRWGPGPGLGAAAARKPAGPDSPLHHGITASNHVYSFPPFGPPLWTSETLINDPHGRP
jgi:hypothetical protein